MKFSKFDSFLDEKRQYVTHNYTLLEVLRLLL